MSLQQLKEVLPQFKERTPVGRFPGLFKSVVADRGFGFIVHDESRAKYGRDVYVSIRTWKDDGFNAEALLDKTLMFTLVEDQFGQPQANDVVFDDIPEVTLNPYRKQHEPKSLRKKDEEDDEDKGKGRGKGKEKGPYYMKQTGRPRNNVETTGERHVGILKVFDKEKEFGFIKCEALAGRYTRDVFLGTRQWQMLQMRMHLPIGTPLAFELAEDEKGHPHATELALEAGMVQQAQLAPEPSVADRVAANAAAFGQNAGVSFPFGPLSGLDGLGQMQSSLPTAVLASNPPAASAMNSSIDDMLKGLGALPALPGLPGLPALPALPGLPGLPGVPAVPLAALPAPQSNVPVQPGCTVQIHSLKTATAINGKIGMVETWVESEGRWMVRLVQNKNQELCAVQPTNLQVLVGTVSHTNPAYNMQALSSSTLLPAPLEAQHLNMLTSPALMDTRPLCQKWQMGACTMGIVCEYSHTVVGNASANDGQQSGFMQPMQPMQLEAIADGAVTAQKTIQCTKWQMGACSLGDACDFAHCLDLSGRGVSGIVLMD